MSLARVYRYLQIFKTVKQQKKEIKLFKLGISFPRAFSGKERRSCKLLGECIIRIGSVD